MNETHFVVELHTGLEDVASQELQELLHPHVGKIHTAKGELSFQYFGPLHLLKRLKTVIAVYLAVNFPVPRPKALLGHQHMTRLLHHIDSVLTDDRSAWASMHLSAAGSDSAVMQRLVSALSDHFKLPAHPEEGDLWLRLRRLQEGWQMLIRLTPRPLSTRPWRVANLEGALSASVAHAMLRMAGLGSDDHLLNLCLGSGTFLAEAQDFNLASPSAGLDIAPDMLDLARRNLTAAAALDRVHLLQADAGYTPFKAQSFSVLCADLPFGQRIGTPQDNAALYPSLLDESARIAQQGARLVLLTHAIQLMSALLPQRKAWRLLSEKKIILRGLHPRIYLLERL